MLIFKCLNLIIISMKVLVQLTIITVVITSLIFTPLQALNIQTNHLRLYKNNSNVRQPVKFYFSFAKKYTKPIFIYGISQYYLGAIYSYQNVSNYMSQLTNTYATVEVTNFGSTNRQWLAIVYIVIEQSSAFLSDCVQDGYISNGAKQMYKQYNVTKTQLDFGMREYDCFPLIKGFYWQDTGSIGFLVNVSVVGKNTYTYRIQAAQNFTAKQIAFYVLFYSKKIFSVKGYLYISSDLIYSEDYKSTSFNETVGQCGQSMIIFGLAGFFSLTREVNRRLGFDVVCENFQNSTKRLIQVSKNNWQKVYFSYLELKIKVQESSLQVYPIALGVVGGVIVIILLVVIIKKCNPCLKIYYPYRQSFSTQNLRSFPSLSL